MPKILIHQEEEIVDNATGELKTSKKTRVFNTKENENYVKLFTTNILKLISLELNKNDYIILLYLVSTMSYSNIINTNKSTKKLITENLKISESMIRKSITNLKKTNILLQTENKGIYYINPIFFGKGKFIDIKNLQEKTNNF